MWGGIASMGVGLLDMIFGGEDIPDAPKYEGPGFDIDPSRLALEQFKKRTDPNSDINRKLFGGFSKLATDAAPTLDSLLGLALAGGSSEGSSGFLARQQARAQKSQIGEEVSQRFNTAFQQQGDLASRFLGLEYQRGQFEVDSSLKKFGIDSSVYSSQYGGAGGGDNFGDQLFKAGLGLLSFREPKT
jgi:hypothetical protein